MPAVPTGTWIIQTEVDSKVGHKEGLGQSSHCIAFLPLLTWRVEIRNYFNL